MGVYIIDDIFEHFHSISNLSSSSSATYQYGFSDDPAVDPSLNGAELSLNDLLLALTGQKFKRLKIQITNTTGDPPTLQISYHQLDSDIHDSWDPELPLSVEIEKSKDVNNVHLHRLRITTRVNENPFPVFVYRKYPDFDRFEWVANVSDLEDISTDTTQELYRWPAVDLVFDTSEKLEEVLAHILEDLDNLAKQYKAVADLPTTEYQSFD